MEWYFRWHANVDSKVQCYHDNAAVMKRVVKFMPILRNRVWGRINDVSVDVPSDFARDAADGVAAGTS